MIEPRELTPPPDPLPGQSRLRRRLADRLALRDDLLFRLAATPDPARPGYSYGFDLLFRGVEIVSGGQRLHRHEDYLAALAARGESPAPYAGYLQVFEHGVPPHGGFAIGLERWTARLTGAANLRQVRLFPRDLHRLSP